MSPVWLLPLNSNKVEPIKVAPDTAVLNGQFVGFKLTARFHSVSSNKSDIVSVVRSK